MGNPGWKKTTGQFGSKTRLACPKPEVAAGGKRGILNCSRQWGKSTVAAAKAVHRAYSEPGSLTLLLTPSGRQSGEFMRKAKEFVRLLGIRVRGDGENKASVLLPNGSRIIGLPESAAKVRGFSNVSLLLFDEASRVTDETYWTMRPSEIGTAFSAGVSVRVRGERRGGVFAGVDRQGVSGFRADEDLKRHGPRMDTDKHG